MAKVKKINSIVSDILEDFLAENGLSLYHTEFKKEGREWFLNVYIDKKETEDGEIQYISSDECEMVSRYLSEQLDKTDPIQQNYYLAVSSPGLDRQLYKAEDYARFKGSLVDVKLYASVDGSKEYQGILVGLEDGNLVISDEDGNKKSFSEAQVVKTCLAVVF